MSWRWETYLRRQNTSESCAVIRIGLLSSENYVFSVSITFAEFAAVCAELRVHVDFLQQGQQASQVTRLRISNDLYETPLILVQNPAPLVERALDALFHDNIPLSDLDKSLSWSTLLIFHLALEAWEADTKHSLPTFHLSFASFAGLLTAEDLDLEKRKIQNRLDELDERLPKIHDLVNSSGNDEQAKLETTRNVFEAMYQLLTVCQVASFSARKYLHINR